jgi:hypothetical protein
MPYKSDAQRRWAHTEAGKEALGGEAAVHEWDEATKGRKLPEKVSKSELAKANLSMPKVASTSVKMPKAKMMPGAFDKPSKFFKSEDFSQVKHPSVQKLKAFLEKVHSKRQS